MIASKSPTPLTTPLLATALLATLSAGAACGSTATTEEPAPSPTPEAAATALPAADPAPEPAAAIPALPPTAEQAATLAAASNAFAFDLYGKVRGAEGNLVFSPASISLAFAMTYAGAANQTAEEMRRTFHYGDDPAALHESAGRMLAAWNDPSRETYQLEVVNRLFGQSGYSFQDDFLALTRQTYRAPLEELDFRADPEAQRGYINEWVSEQTHERIEDLLPVRALDPLTRLVLVNAVYFLGKWKFAFEASNTRDESFYVGGRDAQAVPLMRQTAAHRYGEADGVQILEMPYVGEELAMTIILPRDRDGLGALEERLDASVVEGWLAASRPSTRVQVLLPRFELDDARIPLQDSLLALGMRIPFDRNGADFSAMADPADPDEQLYIAKCFHEAFVKVDEEGTEAAAATAVVMGSRGGRPPPQAAPPTFRADHPFLFMIRDVRSSAILFLGRVIDPR